MNAISARALSHRAVNQIAFVQTASTMFAMAPMLGRPRRHLKMPRPDAYLLRYVQQVRPRCALRNLFLTIKAPIRPLAPSSLHHLVASRMRSLDIRCPRQGPHALRHACATHLVAEGLSLKQIGDHLGHRSPHATRTYAKVDLGGLRQVADFSLGGLL